MFARFRRSHKVSLFPAQTFLHSSNVSKFPCTFRRLSQFTICYLTRPPPRSTLCPSSTLAHPANPIPVEKRSPCVASNRLLQHIQYSCSQLSGQHVTQLPLTEV